MEFKRRHGENIERYFVRLFENKDEYGLTCKAIASLLNDETGNNFDESAYRKEYAAFNRGRAYERGFTRDGVAERILCLSDIHVPHQLPVETYSKYVGIVDTLVLGGDLTDNEAISKFLKVRRSSPMQEIIETRSFIIKLIQYIRPKKVVILYGNHDVRFESYLAKNLDTDLKELMPKTSLELIVEDGFHHYDKESMTKTYYEPLSQVLTDFEIIYADDWKYQIGNTIFCHPSTSSSVPLKTAVNAAEYFMNSGYDFECVVVAHTHRSGEGSIGAKLVYEQGCCCDTSQLKYGDGKLLKPQVEGFLYLCHDIQGNVIRNLTQLEVIKKGKRDDKQIRIN